MGIDIGITISISSIKFTPYDKFNNMSDLYSSLTVISFDFGKEKNEYDISREFNIKKTRLSYSYLTRNTYICKSINDKYFILEIGEYFCTLHKIFDNNIKDDALFFGGLYRISSIEDIIDDLESQRIKILHISSDHDNVYFKENFDWYKLSKPARIEALDYINGKFSECLNNAIKHISSMIINNGGTISIE